MNRDILGGMWKQIRGRVKSAWGELTDDDLKEVEGDRDKLTGKLQERYGWTRERAEREIDSFLDKAQSELKDIDIGGSNW